VTTIVNVGARVSMIDFTVGGSLRQNRESDGANTRFLVFGFCCGWIFMGFVDVRGKG
jgi:hypothetical protein